MTTNLPMDRVALFLNALQLSLKSQVSQAAEIAPAQIKNATFFIQIKPSEDDEHLEFFTKIIAGRWLNDITYNIDDVATALSQDFINFLLITRLNKENMITMAQLAPQYKIFLKKLDFALTTTREVTVENLDQLRKHIFSLVEQDKMTLRELSLKSKITQVGLHNFKKNSDIRCSSLIQICRALGLEIILREAVKSSV